MIAKPARHQRPGPRWSVTAIAVADGVHAGVVLAVYDAFGVDGYKIENSIWYVTG